MPGGWFGDDLAYGQGNYNMTMYVADIRDQCIIGVDYLKTREAAR